MDISQLNTLGKSTDQIKAELLRQAESASKDFIQKQLQDSYNMGYAKGFKEALASFSISQKEIEAFKKQAAQG